MRKLSSWFAISICLMANGSGASPDTNRYTVRSGDTMSLIANRFVENGDALYGPHGKLDALMCLNPQIKNPNLIHPGQIVVVAAHHDREPASEVPPPTLIVPVKSVPMKSETHSIVRADLHLVYVQIDSTEIANGTKGVFVSNLLPEFDLGFDDDLTKTLRLKTDVTFRLNNFLAPNTGQSLQQPGPTTGLRLGVENDLSQRFRARLAAGVQQRLFTRAVSSSAYTFDRVAVPYMEIGGDYTLLEHSSSPLSLFADLQGFGSAKGGTQDAKPGWGYDLGLSLNRRRGNFFTNETVFYSQSQEDSSYVKQTFQELGLTLGIGYAY